VTLKEAEAIQQARHGGDMTTEQLMEELLRTVQQMSPDEKAILRARMLRRAGLIKSSEGKPS
jgi:hypothetical protein